MITRDLQSVVTYRTICSHQYRFTRSDPSIHKVQLHLHSVWRAAPILKVVFLFFVCFMRHWQLKMTRFVRQHKVYTQSWRTLLHFMLVSWTRLTQNSNGPKKWRKRDARCCLCNPRYAACSLVCCVNPAGRGSFHAHAEPEYQPLVFISTKGPFAELSSSPGQMQQFVGFEEAN